MELTQILITVYFLINSFMAGLYTGRDIDYYEGTAQKIGMFLVYLLMAIPYLIMLGVYVFAGALWRFCIFPEVRFYYRINFTDYYEKLIKEDIQKGNDKLFEQLENIANKHSGYVNRRMLRHNRILKEKYQYLFEACCSNSLNQE